MTKPKPKSEHKKNGRPTKLDDPTVRYKFLAAAGIGANTAACCAHAGINPNTYYEYIKANPNFQDEIDQARQEPYLKALTVVHDALTKKNFEFALKYLERTAKDEFSPRREITGRDGKDFFEGRSDDELIKFIESDSTE